VAVARALALDPPLLIADEPTAHLDYVQVEEVLRVLRELAHDDRVVVVATHDHRLLPMADQVVELVPTVAMSTRPPERLELAAGDIVFRQGSWGELIYVVEHGEIEIVGERVDGGEDRRGVMRAGDYFGDFGPLFGTARSATARAVTSATVTGYSTRDFRERVGVGHGIGSRPRRRRGPVRAR
jgi:putative ABC transport system ATP-binding protein